MNKKAFFSFSAVAVLLASSVAFVAHAERATIDVNSQESVSAAQVSNNVPSLFPRKHILTLNPVCRDRAQKALGFRCVRVSEVEQNCEGRSGGGSLSLQHIFDVGTF